MPHMTVVFFQEDDGSCPLLDWLDDLPTKVQDKCAVKVERLVELGHELRRPEADLLRDGIHELRVSYRRRNYRMLYFSWDNHGVVSHGLIKEDVVPEKEIDLAAHRRERFAKNPDKHTHGE